MSVKAVTVYETTNGKKFETRQLALAFEAASTRINKIRAALANPALIRAPDGLAVDIFNKPAVLEELRDACNAGLDYHRRYGKLTLKV